MLFYGIGLVRGVSLGDGGVAGIGKNGCSVRFVQPPDGGPLGPETGFKPPSESRRVGFKHLLGMSAGP